MSEPAERRMLEALVCPVTHAGLSYDAERQELVSKAARLAFPIRDGIPVMLVGEARDLDETPGPLSLGHRETGAGTRVSEDQAPPESG